MSEPTKEDRQKVAELIIKHETNQISYDDYRKQLKELNKSLHSDDFSEIVFLNENDELLDKLSKVF